jgi:hypothetical protein
MGKEGFDNEMRIIEYLNNRKFSSLNPNWKKFIRELFGKNVKKDSFILCNKKAGIHKSDIIISLNNDQRTVSIKSGTGNSVHQEPIEEFISFLRETYSINNDLADKIRFFIWGDETYDGKGKISFRISALEFSKKYPEIIDELKNFFKKNKKDLIERFVITGSKSKSSPDYVYYGGVEEGFWRKSEEILNWLCDDINESNGAIPVGKLTFQAWNRNINGGDKSEKKRGFIQLKWGSIGEDLKRLFEKNE